MQSRMSRPVEGTTCNPFVVIIEQPASKALRFRYECEGRLAGTISGKNSTDKNKSYPTIQVMNYTGRAVVVVSCVTKDAPYKPHPHSLVGREGCRQGVCTLEISGGVDIKFSSLGIQCVKKQDIKAALKLRKKIRVDPFRTGFPHMYQTSFIDLSSVRLCFQVFLEGSTKGKFTVPLKPVVSNAIFDKKAVPDLLITRLSHCNAPCDGGQEMILLCAKVSKDDIEIRFYEDFEGGWVGFGDFEPSELHKHLAITFRSPKFRPIREPTQVKLQLVRPSDGAFSGSVDFEMLPQYEDTNAFKRAKQQPNDPLQSTTTLKTQRQIFGLHNQHNHNLPSFDQTFGFLNPAYQNLGNNITCHQHGQFEIPNVSTNAVPHQESLHLEDFLVTTTSHQGGTFTSPLFEQDQPQSIFSPNVELNEMRVRSSSNPMDLDNEVDDLTSLISFLTALPDFPDSMSAI